MLWGYFCTGDIFALEIFLYWGYFCTGDIFVLGIFLFWGYFCPGDILVLGIFLFWGYFCWGHLCWGYFCMGIFLPGIFLSGIILQGYFCGDILSLNRLYDMLRYPCSVTVLFHDRCTHLRDIHCSLLFLSSSHRRRNCIQACCFYHHSCGHYPLDRFLGSKQKCISIQQQKWPTLPAHLCSPISWQLHQTPWQ